MTLLVDVGNSAIKWAQLATDGTLSVAQRQLHRGVSGIASLLVEHWRGLVPRGSAVVACNVAGPGIVAAVEEAAHALQLKPVRWLCTQRRYDGPFALVNGYENPAQLGADRWHCMLGACATSNAQGAMNSFVVVNAGTATTADCVEVIASGASEPPRFTGNFIGGVIAPGMRLMFESLALQTASLPGVDADLADGAADFPDNTGAAIVTGVIDAQAGLIDRIWRRFAATLPSEPRLILTGGHAETLSARLQRAVDIEHNLVLHGLALRAQSDLSKD